MSLPKSSTLTRSAMPMTRPMSCSTSSTEMPSAARRSVIVTAISAVSVASRPAAGSSSRSRRGLAGERPGDVDALRDAVGQRRRRATSSRSAMPRNAQISSTRARWRRSARAVSRRPQARKPPRVRWWRPSMHVVARGGAGRQRDVLERPPDAEAREPVRAQRGELGLAEPHGALGRPVEPADHVEAARLARPVGPDQGVDRAGLDGELHLVQRGDAAEAQRDAVDDERRYPVHRDSSRRGRCACASSRSASA